MLTERGQQHSFSTHERVFLWKCQSFSDRKCLDLRGTRTPNLRIHGYWVITVAADGLMQLSITATNYRADFMFAPSQWETALLCNDVSHWLGASLEFTLTHMRYTGSLFTNMVLNSSSLGQNCRLFADDTFKCIFVNEKFCILIKISPTFVPKGPIDSNPTLI